MRDIMVEQKQNTQVLDRKIIEMQMREDAQKKWTMHLEQEMQKLILEITYKTFQKDLIKTMGACLKDVDWQIGDMVFHFENADKKELVKRLEEMIKILEDQLQPKRVQHDRLSKEHEARLKHEREAAQMALEKQKRIDALKNNMIQTGQRGFRRK